jgi:uncharacterized RDD family membrane protein YckC
MSPITILDQSNTPIGPFTREQVAEKLQKGEVTMSSLAFIEGLSQWTPLRDVLARVDASAPPSRSAPTSVPAAPAPAPLTSAPAYSYAATMAPPPHLVYAGFWLRFAAIFIDGLVLSPLVIIYLVLVSILSADAQNNGANMQESIGRLVLALGILVYILLMNVVVWLYFALFESRRWQATLGKKAMGLRVTGLDGSKIGFGRATGRYFGKIISHLILYIGFMMAGFTERKQALHDMIAGTLVVRN